MDVDKEETRKGRIHMIPFEDVIKKLVEEHAVSPFGYGRSTNFEVYVSDIPRTFRAGSKEELVYHIIKFYVERAKDEELTELAKKWGHEHGQYMALPEKGVVKLVMENCPTWREINKDLDPRGIGNKVGRRIMKLGIQQVRL
jgi:hypothetical protein